MTKDDVLGALGLATRPSTASSLLGALGLLTVGILVGAGAALLLAPKSGRELRGSIGEGIRKATDRPAPTNAAPSV
jgi:gas vesicle protein